MDEGGSVDEVSLSLCLSLKRLCGGDLGGAPSQGPWKMRLEVLWMLASLSVGATLSPRRTRHGEGSYTGDSDG